MTRKEITKGTIEIAYRPTACHICNKILAQTYMRKDDIEIIRFHVYCEECFKKKFES